MKLSRLHKIILYSLFVAIFATGATKALYQYILQPGGPLSPGYSSLEQSALSAHGIIAQFYLLALGSLFPVHMKKGWSTRKNVASGIFFLAVHVVLIVSGLALYYAANEWLREIGVGIHLWVGLLLPILLIGHIWMGRGGSQNAPLTARIDT